MLCQVVMVAHRWTRHRGECHRKGHRPEGTTGLASIPLRIKQAILQFSAGPRKVCGNWKSCSSGRYNSVPMTRPCVRLWIVLWVVLILCGATLPLHSPPLSHNNHFPKMFVDVRSQTFGEGDGGTLRCVPGSKTKPFS